MFMWAAKKCLGCNLLDSRSLSKTEFISSFLFTPEVELGVFDVFFRVSSKTVLFFPESKLDATFNDNLFIAEGYKLLRRDRDSKGGGILAYINTDFPVSRKTNLRV
jgi:hypothetical protein